jgi:3-oxoacyl-[acyl-carrier protein] reductase
MSQLSDKVNLAMGGGRRLGRAIALVFAEAGAHIAVACRAWEQSDEVAGVVRAKSRRGLAVPVDVADTGGELAQ